MTVSKGMKLTQFEPMQQELLALRAERDALTARAAHAEAEAARYRKALQEQRAYATAESAKFPTEYYYRGMLHVCEAFDAALAERPATPDSTALDSVDAGGAE